jgi:hypothetical protein
MNPLPLSTKFARFAVVVAALATVHTAGNATEISTSVNIKKTVTFKGDFASLKADFEKKEEFLRLFPNIDTLKATGEADTYFYRMKPMGSAGVMHVTEYVAAYQFQQSDNVLTVNWKTVPGQGNAQLNGKTTYSRVNSEDITINLVVQGELLKIEVPALYALGAGPVTRSLFEKNIDQFMAILEKTYKTK